MTGHVVAALAAGLALTAVLMRAHRASYVLPAWLALVCAGELAALARTQTMLAFALREAALEGLEFGLALELTRETLGRVPRGRREAELALLVLLVVGAGGVWWARAGNPARDAYRTLALGHGVAALALLAVGRVAARYFVPLHPVVEVAVLWLPAYLAAQVLLLGAAAETSARLSASAAVTSTVAWVGLCGAFAAAAWRARSWRPLEHLASPRWR